MALQAVLLKAVWQGQGVFQAVPVAVPRGCGRVAPFVSDEPVVAATAVEPDAPQADVRAVGLDDSLDELLDVQRVQFFLDASQPDGFQEFVFQDELRQAGLKLPESHGSPLQAGYRYL